ncbi:MAG TPA: HD domain-containing protein, partial [Candidatus Saccharimonadales bacterium]|nr:HD domain-containing protein [Candidatus Saccharimonadales bacterium]
MNETRQEIERREEETLPPWALRSGRATRSRPLDPEGRVFDYRTEYQRDRDRILHSRSFRRLRQKMDGGATSPVDPRRDRLTHTLEVTQLARTIARALSLNEDLTEAIALGHDLGCPPFGSSGARALDRLLGRRRRPLQGGFRVPVQSLRVVDLLEKRYEHEGLNLTHDVREGILKQDDPASSGAAPAAARPRPA